MKKIIALSALVAILSGCDGWNHKTCRDSVVQDVGTQNVVEVNPWKFVAKDAEGNVWYYETMNNSNTNITKKTPVFFSSK